MRKGFKGALIKHRRAKAAAAAAEKPNKIASGEGGGGKKGNGFTSRSHRGLRTNSKAGGGEDITLGYGRSRYNGRRWRRRKRRVGLKSGRGRRK